VELSNEQACVSDLLIRTRLDGGMTMHRKLDLLSPLKKLATGNPENSSQQHSPHPMPNTTSVE